MLEHFPNKKDQIYKVGSFSSQDLLADIDAFNITTLILNFNDIKLSDAINLYYNSVENDMAEFNRYRYFIYACTRATTLEKTGNLLQDFKNEVYSAMNLKITNQGVVNYNYHNRDTVMRLIKANDEMPSVSIRSYVASLFYDYIVINAGLI